MCWASTGPTPGSVCSCSSDGGVEVDRAAGAARPPAPRRRRAAPVRTAAGAAAPAGPDHDLLPVDNPRGEVEAAQVDPGQRAAGGPHGVVDPRAGRQPVQPGPAHLAGDVDHDHDPRAPTAAHRREPTAVDGVGAGGAPTAAPLPTGVAEAGSVGPTATTGTARGRCSDDPATGHEGRDEHRDARRPAPSAGPDRCAPAPGPPAVPPGPPAPARRPTIRGRRAASSGSLGRDRSVPRRVVGPLAEQLAHPRRHPPGLTSHLRTLGRPPTGPSAVSRPVDGRTGCAQAAGNCRPASC